jgi:hypothetical protein
MNKDSLRQIINVAATVLTLLLNGLANALPINGQSTGAISDRFEVFFVPAGYVFSIWGVIYIALIAFTVYQALPAQRENPLLRRIGYLYAFSGLMNSIWILFWHYNIFSATMVVMLALLGSLIAIYLLLEIGQTPVSRTVKWLVHIPFSIYLGWITVATVANATSLLDYLNWDGFGISGQVWAIIMLLAATAITAGMILTRRDIAYSLVIIWAFIGIAVKQQETLLVAVPAALLALAVAATMAVCAARVPKTETPATT